MYNQRAEDKSKSQTEMNTFQKFRGHFKTITKHKYYVFKMCHKAGITWQGIIHDLSKYSPTEFIPGVRYFQGYRSPNEGEREDLGYSAAWMHHKGRNKHHFEYWNDLNLETHKYGPVKMPLKYVKEMFCDRVAASKIYGKDKYTDHYALDYFNKRKEHPELHPETGKLLLKLLTMLAEKGEDRTFAYIRRLRRY